MTTYHTCHSCGSSKMSVFYELKNVPVHSVLLMSTREAAVGYRRGEIVLAYCQACGFISNIAFDPTVHEYSSRYEETQSFSPTFNAFHRRLALRLIDKYDLHNKDIIEIGCGKGEFLTMLCELGGNRGIGFDPSYVSGRSHSDDCRATFINDFYSEKYASYRADFVCCKMTLEHIQQTRGFLSTLRRSIGDREEAVVFFQVPNVTRILYELAFWDIYYEHCSYFSPGSLARLFQGAGFDTIELSKEYGGQYLTIEARPGNWQDNPTSNAGETLEDLERAVHAFSRDCKRKVDAWKEYLRQMMKSGQRVIIWGGGSKAVAFLTTLGVEDGIKYAVDINPHKHGMYLPGTGQQVIGPDLLRFYQPGVVILMNRIYGREVQHDLDCMNLHPELVSL